MIAVALFLGWYFPHHFYGGISEMFEALVLSGKGYMLTAPGLEKGGQEPWSWWAFSSWCIVSGLGMSSWPHIFMKAFTSGSDRSFRKTLVLYPTFQIIMIPIMFIGFAAILAFPGVEPDTIVPFLLTKAGLPALVVGLLSAGVLAASMSSGDTILHATASIFVRDGVRKLPWNKPMNDTVERRAILASIIVVSGISFYFAAVSTLSLGAIIGAAFGGVAQIMPVLLATFYWRRATSVGVIGGLIAGISVNVFFWAQPDMRPVPMHEGMFGLFANVAVLILLSLVTRAPSKAVVDPYFAK